MFCIIVNDVEWDMDNESRVELNRVIGPFPTSKSAFGYLERNMDYTIFDMHHTCLVVPMDNPLAVAMEQGKQFGHDGANHLAKIESQE